jgi:YD repeat-containing protein
VVNLANRNDSPVIHPALLTAIAWIALVLIGHVRAEMTFRDSMGRVQGYATKRGNTTTYTDPQGRETGRAERHRGGTTNVYDNKGRLIGTTTRR